MKNYFDGDGLIGVDGIYQIDFELGPKKISKFLAYIAGDDDDDDSSNKLLSVSKILIATIITI